MVAFAVRQSVVTVRGQLPESSVSSELQIRKPKTSSWSHTFPIFTFQVHRGREAGWSLQMQLSRLTTR